MAHTYRVMVGCWEMWNYAMQSTAGWIWSVARIGRDVHDAETLDKLARMLHRAAELRGLPPEIACVAAGAARQFSRRRALILATHRPAAEVQG